MSLAEDIKTLREKTGAGLMACKKALEENNNDMEQAIVYLRKKGLADLAKRADRATKEGRVSVKTDGKHFAMAYLGCETDFVAKTPDFIGLADDIADYVLKHPEITDYTADETIKNMIVEKAPKFGENTTFKGAYNWTAADGNVIASYVHSDNKKASLLELAANGADTAKATEIARGLAMHTVGMQSMWVEAKDIPEADKEKELDIYRTQAKNEGKSDEMIAKMLPGKLKKFAKETCLLEQPTIKDNKKTVADYLAEESKTLGGELKVVRFVRF